VLGDAEHFAPRRWRLGRLGRAEAEVVEDLADRHLVGDEGDETHALAAASAGAGWLALGAGIAGGADVILIPEIPPDIAKVADAIQRRSRGGKRFSIVAVAEGTTLPSDIDPDAEAEGKSKGRRRGRKKTGGDGDGDPDSHGRRSLALARRLEELTGLESRVTILGHLLRGGTPSAADRILATRLDTACAELIHKGHFGVMVAPRGDGAVPVPLEDVVGKRKTVPLDHSWVETARAVGTTLGD
jgi:6-phosphofructokinase